MKNFSYLSLKITFVVLLLTGLSVSSSAQKYTIGAPSPAIGASAAFTALIQFKLFDVLNPSGVWIDTVDIYPTGTIGAAFTIVVQNASSTVIASYSGVITATGGNVQRVPVSLQIPAGVGYRMGFSVNPGMTRNSTGGVYPYTVPGVMSITGNTFNTVYYYFFYNIKISTPPPTNAAITAINVPSNSTCEGSHPVSVKLKNNGPNDLLNTKIDWEVNGAAQTTLNFAGTLTPGQDSTVVIGSFNFTGGTTYSLKATSVTPNGSPDLSMADDSLRRNNIQLLAYPKGSLSGGSNFTICKEDTVDVEIGLTGTPPWKVYVYDGVDTTKYNNVSTSTFIRGYHPDMTTNYKITYLNDLNGCESFTGPLFKVNVKPIPEFSLGNDTVVCAFQTVVLKGAGSPATNSWSTGESSEIIIVDSAGVGTGTKTITLTADLNGCSVTESVNVSFDGCVGIEETVNGMPLSIYPNPSEGIFRLQYDGSEGSYEVMITDNTGKVVHRSTYNYGEGAPLKMIDISGSPAGLYTVKVSGDQSSATARIILQ